MSLVFPISLDIPDEYELSLWRSWVERSYTEYRPAEASRGARWEPHCSYINLELPCDYTGELAKSYPLSGGEGIAGIGLAEP
jgi:hypothetical protein